MEVKKTLDLNSIDAFGGNLNNEYQIVDYLNNTHDIGLPLPVYDDDIKEIFDRADFKCDFDEFLSSDMSVDMYLSIYHTGKIETAGFLKNGDGNITKHFYGEFFTSFEKEKLIEKLAEYPEIMKSLDMCCAYEKYKDQWVDEHISKERQDKAKNDYMDNYDEYLNFTEYLDENGYDGELYADFDEFCDNDYEEFTKGNVKYAYAFKELGKANPYANFSKARNVAEKNEKKKGIERT